MKSKVMNKIYAGVCVGVPVLATAMAPLPAFARNSVQAISIINPEYTAPDPALMTLMLILAIGAVAGVIAGIVFLVKRSKKGKAVVGAPCAVPVTAAPVAAQPVDRFCPKCGNKVKAGSAFCAKCGNQMK